MTTEAKEEKHIKLKKEDVGPLFTFYTQNVVNAAERWQCKSVSIKSPKSGRIFRQKKNSEKRSSKIEEKAKDRFSLNRLSRLFEDFKKAKVSDFEYQQSKIRQDSSYRPFWATKVVQTFRKTDPEPSVVPRVASTIVESVESGNLAANKKAVFETNAEPIALSKVIECVERTNVVAKGYDKDSIGSPKVTLAKVKSPKKIISNVVYNEEHRLRNPPFYNGSKMRMPTGERLYWVCYSFFN